MLELLIEEERYFDEDTERFVNVPATKMQLEHSLISLSKWESKWEKAYLGKEAKTREETIDYIRCMTITKNVDPVVYETLSAENINRVVRYIQKPMTATTFGSSPKTPVDREVITSEIVYYWMIASNIPMECQKWHLNRLLTLIRVCSIKNTPKGKQPRMNKADIASQRRALNAQRRAMAEHGG